MTKRILLIVSGGIAAYKALELVRLLRREDLAVRAVMTKAAQQFVTPLSLGVLTEDHVYGDMFDLKEEREIGHIQLSREADLIVICPATADLLAKMASGICDDLATTLLLATDAPVLAVPAMNVRMWHHPATQRNLATLRADGVTIMEPDDGDMACGEYGRGRLPEPPAIVDEVKRHLTRPKLPLPGAARQQPPVPSAGEVRTPNAANPKHPLVPSEVEGRTRLAPLAGKHILITAGPTHEPIDPVRYIANRSSGRQGFAIAQAAAEAGARVTLVAGPVTLPTPPGVTRIDVQTAREMQAAVNAHLPADAAIMVAAVADWRAETSPIKRKKQGEAPQPLALLENPDILAELAHSPDRPRLVIGFAAETNDVLPHARAKLAKKGADWIVANDVSGDVMGGEANSIHLLTQQGAESWDRLPKAEVARKLMEKIAHALA